MPAEEVPLLRIAVVVASDGRHPEWLSVALRSIEAQPGKPAELCLIVDSPDGAATFSALDVNLSPRGWTVRQGCWGGPPDVRSPRSPSRDRSRLPANG